MGDNPYSPPVEPEAPRPGSAEAFDLPDDQVWQVRFVLTTWKSVLLLTVACCLGCFFLYIPMFFWYGGKLFVWHYLNPKYNELRFPNAFSKHSQLASDFQDSYKPLWAGTLVGLMFLTLVGYFLYLANDF